MVHGLAQAYIGTVPANVRFAPIRARAYDPVVTDAAKKLLQEVLALPEEEQRWLADRLIDHVPREPQEDIDGAWRDEAIRRAEELERGEGETLEGETAVREIETELRSHRSR